MRDWANNPIAMFLVLRACLRVAPVGADWEMVHQGLKLETDAPGHFRFPRRQRGDSQCGSAIYSGA
jgi:hypothetical protein